MTIKKVLFVTHKKSQCGVYEFGENVFDAIRHSTKYQHAKAECESIRELREAIAREQPAAIIYNYMPETMPWVARHAFRHRWLKNNIASIPVPQIGIIHSVLQSVADSAQQGRTYKRRYPELANSLFDFYIAPDPTLLLKNPLVYKHGRPLQNVHHSSAPERLTIGSFGFAKEGFEQLIRLVQSEFDDAEIRLHLPFAKFGDSEGQTAMQIADECRALIHKPSITLSISHHYLAKDELMGFLSSNSLNVFLRPDEGRGISSVIDYALPAGRPIAISKSRMFRHILGARPSIDVSVRSLEQILRDGTQPLTPFLKDWTAENMCWEYDRILDSVLTRCQIPDPATTKQKALHFAAAALARVGFRKYRRFGRESTQSNWIVDTSPSAGDGFDADSTGQRHDYLPVEIDLTCGFNRILDNSARATYRPAVNKLVELAPITMQKKIPEANVQQAFIFDTVYRHLSEYSDPAILCVGSFEDTACIALQKMGVGVDEVDPVINYTLQEFVSKPSNRRKQYDIIFSTSVIEHDPDDRSFMECAWRLLAPNGLLILTCDYKDGWKPGDSKPWVCERMYTRMDLEERLPSYLDGSVFLSGQDWSCPTPDFYLGDHNYTFATFSVRKAAAAC